MQKCSFYIKNEEVNCWISSCQQDRVQWKTLQLKQTKIAEKMVMGDGIRGSFL